MTKVVLVVGAHTDDEHGMSGLIRLMANDGHQIHLIITTDGISNAEARKAEMARAASILGIKSVSYLGEPDGKLYVVPEVITKFNALLDTLPKPDVVFVMHAYDFHPDHRRTADLVVSSKLNDRGTNTPTFSYALNSSGRAHKFVRVQSYAFHPTHYCVVDSVIEVMRDADSSHVTQDAPEMWKGVLANLTGRASELAHHLNENKGIFARREHVEYAEAFIYVTRLGKSPQWMDKYFVQMPMKTAAIPFEVTPESIFYKPS